MASKEVTEFVTRLMSTLNRDAAEVMKKYPVHACTDITGFGLLGHLSEMVSGSGCGIRLKSGSIPVIHEALEYAVMGLVPAGSYKNREFYAPGIDMSPSVDRSLADILYDPQTSGGLLICVSGESAGDLMGNLIQQGMDFSAIIGEVVSEPAGKIGVS